MSFEGNEMSAEREAELMAFIEQNMADRDGSDYYYN